MQGAIADIHELFTFLHNIYVQLDTISSLQILQEGAAEVCIFYDNNVENEAFAGALRLANDMATQCVEATTLNMCKSRFTSTYSCIKALSS